MMGEEEETIEMFGRMHLALLELEACVELAPLVPEVRTNLVYARKRARTPEDVLGIEGRITVIAGMPRAAGRPSWGASSHMARLVIELMRTDPGVRAGVDFRADSLHLIEWLEAYAKEREWTFSVIDRSMEPQELHDEEAASMPWKVAEAIRAADDQVPKLFYETGAIGKEPVAVLVGPDPIHVAKEVTKIARLFAEAVP